MIGFLGLSIYLLIALVCGIMLSVMAFMGFGHDLNIGGHDLNIGGHDMDGSTGVDHFTGGHGDFSGAHLSPLSFPLILAFGTSFGGFGALFEAMGWNVYLTPLMAAVIAVIIAVIMYFAMDRLFFQTQASSDIRYSKLIGMEATTTIPIKPGQSGQVLVITEARGRTLLPAVAKEDIPTDSAVMIEGFAGGSLVVRRKRLGE
jgi:membrane protein implicated in regulation of membrane protease activity